MAMLDIAPYWGKPDKLTPPAPTSFTAKWVAAVTNRPDDWDCFTALGIRVYPPKPLLPSATAKTHVDPQCPSSPPAPVPVACPEPETVTLGDALVKAAGGRPAPKLVKPVPGSQVIIFAGEDKDLSKYHLAPFASDEEKQANRKAIFDAMRRGEITGDEANALFDRNIHMRILIEDHLLNPTPPEVLCLA